MKRPLLLLPLLALAAAPCLAQDPATNAAAPDWTEYFLPLDELVEPDCVNDTNVWTKAFFSDFDAFRDALLAALRDRDGATFAKLVDERYRAEIGGEDCDIFDKAYFRRIGPVGRFDARLRRIGPDDRNRLLAAMPDETNRVGRMFVCIVCHDGENGPALSLPLVYGRGSFRIASPRGWIRFGETVPDIVPSGTVFADGTTLSKADGTPIWIPRFRSPASDALADALAGALRGDPDKYQKHERSVARGNHARSRMHRLRPREGHHGHRR